MHESLLHPKQLDVRFLFYLIISTDQPRARYLEVDTILTKIGTGWDEIRTGCIFLIEGRDFWGRDEKKIGPQLLRLKIRGYQDFSLILLDFRKSKPSRFASKSRGKLRRISKIGYISIFLNFSLKIGKSQDSPQFSSTLLDVNFQSGWSVLPNLDCNQGSGSF